MTRMVALKVPEEELRRLDEVAHRHGVTRSALIRRGLAVVLAWSGMLDEHDRTVRATDAMFSGGGGAGDWKRVEDALRRSRPKWRTLDAAMSASRGRPWRTA